MLEFPHDAHGEEWLIDAFGCAADRLRDGPLLRSLADEIVSALRLTLVGAPVWHQFPAPGGWTGMYLLSESHLTCHTFPETGVATWNLYCCRARPRWEWEAAFERRLGARHVRVHRFPRGAPTAAAGMATAAGMAAASGAVQAERADEAEGVT